MKNFIIAIVLLLIIALAIALPSWLFMLGLGNVGVGVGFVGSLPFGVLFWWLLSAIFYTKDK